jgi:hypothetical protein
MKKKIITRPPHKHVIIRKLLQCLGVIVLALIVIGVVLNIADLQTRKTTTRTNTYSFTGTTLTFASLSSGTVTIVPGDVGKMTVTQKITEGIRKLTTTEQVSGQSIVLRQHGCTGIDLGWYGACNVTFTVTVPLDTTIVAKNSNASFIINGVSGNHSIQTTDGSITLNRLNAANLALSSNNGNITVEEVHSDVAIRAASNAGSVRFNQASTTSLILSSNDGDVTADNVSASSINAGANAGSVHLQLAGSPSKLVATSNDGGITIRVPHNQIAYKTTVTSDDGTAKANIKTDPGNMKNIIDAHANDGSVTVSY